MGRPFSGINLTILNMWRQKLTDIAFTFYLIINWSPYLGFCPLLPDHHCLQLPQRPCLSRNFHCQWMDKYGMHHHYHDIIIFMVFIIIKMFNIIIMIFMERLGSGCYMVSGLTGRFYVKQHRIFLSMLTGAVFAILHHYCPPLVAQRPQCTMWL